MHIKKRAQITVFVVLGMVMLVIFLFLNKAANDVEKLRLEKQAQDILSGLENTESIQYYVKLCLKDSAEEALSLIGKQGGRIWDYQNGSSSLSYYRTVNTDEDSFNVSFGLYEHSLNPPNSASSYPDIPWYPENFFGHFFINKSRRDYPFGINKLPYLCDKNGPNAYNNSKLYSGISCSPIDGKELNKEKYLSAYNDTIQIQLSVYASKKLKDCLDPDFLKKTTGYDLTFKDPETLVILGEDDVMFNAIFPTEISLQNNKTRISTTRKISFSTKIPVRLKRIYDLSYTIIDEDRKNISFLFIKDAKSKEIYAWLNRTYTKLEITSSHLSENPDIEIVRIIDNALTIRGEPYTFQFLRMNRPPVLDWIHKNEPSDVYDISVPELTRIEINPIGYDPDEDSYIFSGAPKDCVDKYGEICMIKTYSYSGWKETEDYYFDYTCCAQRNYVECLPNCVTYPEIQPHNWTKSSLYQLNNRDADYITKGSDIGHHRVNISVCDDHGVCDWQIVNILVYDTPTPVAKGINFFADINSSFASDEDPYMLSASQSTIIASPTSSQPPYKWCDNIEFPLCYIFRDANIILPNTTFSIENITLPKMNFFNYSKAGGKNLTHKINLTLPPNEERVDEINVNVFRCVPHRNPNVKSYPYNNFSFDPYTDNSDPFQADHTCCHGSGDKPSSGDPNWGVPFGISKVCYSLTEYGTYKGFTTEYLQKLYDLKLTQSIYGFLSIIHPSGMSLGVSGFSVTNNNLQNDIFKREILRNCDGSRGNICNGTLTDTITNISCSDKTWSNTNRRCEGPSSSTSVMQNPATPPICQKYDYSTYEYNFENPLNNQHLRTCSDLTRCSTQNAYNISTGNFLANGTCDGAGGCTKVFTQESYNCYELNSCTDTDTSTSRYLSGRVYGINYSGCQNTAASAQCLTNSYNIQDRCSGNSLIKYGCKTTVDQKIYPAPFKIDTTIDCETGDSGPKCEETIQGSGVYKSRGKGSCSSDKCVDNSTWSFCGSYKCNGDECATTCSQNDNAGCIQGYHCVNVINGVNTCLDGGDDAFCDDDADCTNSDGINRGCHQNTHKCKRGNGVSCNSMFTCNSGLNCIAGICSTPT